MEKRFLIDANLIRDMLSVYSLKTLLSMECGFCTFLKPQAQLFIRSILEFILSASALSVFSRTAFIMPFQKLYGFFVEQLS